MSRMVLGPLLLAAALVAGGCGYVGDPLPPLLNIPERVTDLEALQRGDRIIARFSIPHLTTEGVVLRSPARLDVRAGEAGDPFNAGEWAAGARQVPGGVVEAGRARYEMPVGGWVGKEIVIGVRAVGENGRDAGWSNFAVVQVVPPLRQPTNLRAEAAADGVRLSWQGAAPRFRVFRRAPGEPGFTQVGEAQRPSWTDPDVQYGRTYEYAVQAVLPAGGGQAESERSAPAAITPEDRFPPAVPSGLTAVASPAGMELLWDRNAEPDLAGYKVWRAAPGSDFEAMGEVSDPGYSDRTAEAGPVYRYTVSAVDKSGNESARAEPVEISRPRPDPGQPGSAAPGR